MKNEKIPRHIAIIMDGNGRWAERQGLPRVRGHQEGARRIEDLIRTAPELGIGYLTFYAFSKENWQRPKAEVAFLMELLSRYLDEKLDAFQKNNLVFHTIGETGDLPETIRKKIARNTEQTRKNTGMVVTFAFSYSSRLEITQACRSIAQKAAAGELVPGDISEQTVAEHLYTKNLPDPDLLIRTSGEMRISNFLLWQISYAEIYVTGKCWPDFGPEELVRAVEDYQKRERRFGRTAPAAGGAA